MGYTEITTAGKLDEIKGAVQAGRVVLYFTATWCGPCQVISPIFSDLTNNHEGIKFYKIDVDGAHDVAAAYGITAMPTFLFFKDGEQIDSVRGADKNRLTSLVTSLASA